MDAVIMGEFGKRKVFNPGVRVFLAIDMEIGFKFLIHMFGLSICLEVIGSRKNIGVLEEMTKF